MHFALSQITTCSVVGDAMFCGGRLTLKSKPCYLIINNPTICSPALVRRNLHKEALTQSTTRHSSIRTLFRGLVGYWSIMVDGDSKANCQSAIHTSEEEMLYGPGNWGRVTKTRESRMPDQFFAKVDEPQACKGSLRSYYSPYPRHILWRGELTVLLSRT